MRLVELGASAGLNLLADRFGYRYLAATGGAGTKTGGVPAAGTVVCESTVSGAPLPRLGSPVIAERIGVDLEPVDLESPEARRWLLACVWPDEPDRVARLRAAIALARRDPPTVDRGDALAALPALVAGEAHPVIWHSWVLAYWTTAAQFALAAAVDVLGASRDLTWIYLEPPSETPGLPTPIAGGARHDPADCALVAVRYRAGARRLQRLADVQRMRWLARSR